MLIQLIYNSVYITILNCDRKTIRKIGYIENNVFYIHNSGKHKYNYYRTLGICYQFLRHSPEKLFFLICIEQNNAELWTSRLSYLHYGKIIDYQKQGFEKQLLLELNRFHKTRAEAEAELRELSLATGLQFKKDISEKLKGLARAVKLLQGGIF